VAARGIGQWLDLGVGNLMICSVRGCRLELAQEASLAMRWQTMASQFTINCLSPFFVLLGLLLAWRDAAPSDRGAVV
jgi:hypothetical protein